MKLQIGGSPCTKWSIANTTGRETEPEGLGWELFNNYLIALDKFRPDYFLYENNKSMSAAIRAQITKKLGVEPVLINSALVSAQNRQRLYWTNIPGVEQPADLGILLRDVLELGISWPEKAYTLRASNGAHGSVSSVLKTLKEPGKFPCNGAAVPVAIGYRNRREADGKLYRRFEGGDSQKANALTTVQTDSMVAEPMRIGTIESAAKNVDFDSQQYRVYSPDGKSVTLCGNGGGVGAKTGLYAVPLGSFCVVPVVFDDEGQMIAEIGERQRVIYEVRGGEITIKGRQYPIKLRDGFYIIRKLTVLECKRLQTVPDSYIFPVSDSQAYKMMGNGWTVDVIAHILSYCPGITGEPLEVLSMYDGMSCGHIALDKLGARVAAYWATEIDKYAIKTTQTNYPDTVQLGDTFQVREDGWEPWRYK